MFANNDDNESETAKPIKMIVVGDRKTLLVNMHMTKRLVHIVIMVTNGLSITSHNKLISRIQYCESHVIFSDSTRLYRFDAIKLLLCRTMFCPLSWHSILIKDDTVYFLWKHFLFLCPLFVLSGLLLLNTNLKSLSDALIYQSIWMLSFIEHLTLSAGDDHFDKLGLSLKKR